MKDEIRKALALQVGLIVVVAIWMCLALAGVVLAVYGG